MLHVIIPTLNAADALDALLTQLGSARVIVADGGSTDTTLHVAARLGASLAIGQSGRGSQLRLGADLALRSGEADDWFLFIHADSTLPENWRAVVDVAMLRPNPRFFRLSTNRKGFAPWLMEKLVAFRSLGWALPYGDQGLLISRADYLACGGYPDWPLFEDVAIVEKLSGLLPLDAKIITDVSAYERDGYWQRGRRNFKLLRDYRRGVSPHELLDRYR